MQMPVEISFRGMNVSEAVEAKVREWAARLDAVFDRIMRCEVVIEAPHRHQRQGRQFHVRIALTVPGREIVVSHDPGTDAAHEDVYVAVRDSFRAARRQLEDHVREVQGAVKAHEALPHGRIAGA